MGRPRDMMQRVTLARIDGVNRRSRVAAARKCIYEKNYAVNSRVVENLLQEDSLVPTAVGTCFLSKIVFLIALIHFRTHFRTSWHNSVLICSACSL
jgi:hypothetical protein